MVARRPRRSSRRWLTASRRRWKCTAVSWPDLSGSGLCITQVKMLFVAHLVMDRSSGRSRRPSLTFDMATCVAASGCSRPLRLKDLIVSCVVLERRSGYIILLEDLGGADSRRDRSAAGSENTTVPVVGDDDRIDAVSTIEPSRPRRWRRASSRAVDLCAARTVTVDRRDDGDVGLSRTWPLDRRSSGERCRSSVPP